MLRFLMGVSECGNYTAGIKAIAALFPTRNRASAGGLFNAGAQLGSIVATPLVVLIATRLGWRPAFLIPAIVGLLWLIPWLMMYRRPEDHPRVSAAELAYIRSDAPEPTTEVKWTSLLLHRP